MEVEIKVSIIMNKKNRVKKNEEFQLIFKNGQSFANRQFVVYVLKKENQPNFRIGLSVSKKIGKAVTRNRVKRYIRQVFQELKEQIQTGYDFVIIARMPVAEMDYYQVKKSLIHVLKRAKVWKGNKTGHNGNECSE
jgi:ribonuclease P protein component